MATRGNDAMRRPARRPLDLPGCSGRRRRVPLAFHPRARRQTVGLLGLLTLALLPAALPAAEPASATPTALTVVFFPIRQATLASEVEAKVLAVHKELGDAFAKGEALIELDRRAFAIRRDQAAAEVELAQQEVTALTALYRDRSRSLLELMQAQTELARAEARLTLIAIQLAACTIQAPYAGRVTQVQVHAHELVQRGQKLIAIVDDTQLVARFFLPHREARRCRPGSGVTIHLRERGGTVAGRVIRAGRTVDPTTGTLEVHALVENDTGELRSGLVGSLDPDDIQPAPAREFE